MEFIRSKRSFCACRSRSINMTGKMGVTVMPKAMVLLERLIAARSLSAAELGNPRYVKPLTIMTIDECENVLPHIAAGDFPGEISSKHASMVERSACLRSARQYTTCASPSIPNTENSYLSNRYDIARIEIIEPLRTPETPNGPGSK